MSTVTRNRRLRPSRALAGTVGAFALAGTLVLSGCGTGQLSQTANQYAAVNGSGAAVGEIALRDVQVVYPSQPASPDAAYPRGASAPLRFGIVNQGTTADRLVGITSPVAARVTVSGDTSLPTDLLLAAGGEPGSAPAGVRPITIELSGLTQPIRAGLTVPVTFTFERAGAATINVPLGAPPEGSSAGEPERVESEAGATEQPPAPQATPEVPATPQAPAAPGAPQPAAPAPQGTS